MRIGIDATALPPEPVGAGTYILQLIRSLLRSDSGHEWVIFAHRANLPLFESHLYGNAEWVAVTDKNPATRLIWEQAVFPFLVNSLQIDILHSPHYTRPIKLNCASVVTLHDMTFILYPRLHTLPKRFLFTFMIRSSARRANALVTVSETTRQDAIQLLKVPTGKIFTIPNGVSSIFRQISDHEQRTIVQKKYGLPDDFFLYVGTIEPRKNLPLLLKAFSRLVQAGDSHHLVIVGRRGWRTEQVWDTMRQLNLGDRVHFTGYIPVQDLPIVYNLARLFVYPTLYEGFGLPPLEAMACGTPVIVSAVPAVQEHVGNAGLFFPPHDEDALFQALKLLANDPHLRAELSGKGLRRASQFTWERCATATLKVYQSIAH